MLHAQCTMHHQPCTMHHAPCTINHAPCSMHHAPCTINHAPRTMRQPGDEGSPGWARSSRGAAARDHPHPPTTLPPLQRTGGGEESAVLLLPSDRALRRNRSGVEGGPSEQEGGVRPCSLSAEVFSTLSFLPSFFPYFTTSFRFFLCFTTSFGVEISFDPRAGIIGHRRSEDRLEDVWFWFKARR